MTCGDGRRGTPALARDLSMVYKKDSNYDIMIMIMIIIIIIIIMILLLLLL